MSFNISENIKTFRVDRGFTQGELAALLSVSPQAVSRWENGQAYPDIEVLPSLAYHLDVSVDELIGVEGTKINRLKKELSALDMNRSSPSGTTSSAELRILDIYEELSRVDEIHTRKRYLSDYFHHLMDHELWKKLNVEISEERKERARKMLRENMHELGMADRIELLNIVARFEDEDKLISWEYEYKFPWWLNGEYFWDDMLLSRYYMEGDKEKCKRQMQKLIYGHLEAVLRYLLIHSNREGMETDENEGNIERYKTALHMINAYSTRVDDVFLPFRIVAQVRCAETYFAGGHDEEGLEALTFATKWINILRAIPLGTEVNASSWVLEGFAKTFDVSNMFEDCLGNIARPEICSLYDRVSGDPRYTEFSDALEKFFPANKRSFFHEDAPSCMDSVWEKLLDRGKEEIKDLDDGGALVVLTANGNTHAMRFCNIDFVIRAKGAMKFFAKLKKNGDAKLDRVLWMFHEGSIDQPSAALRDVILSIEKSNKEAIVLLNGFNDYITKPLWMYR